jgi:hypothetical protein
VSPPARASAMRSPIPTSPPVAAAGATTRGRVVQPGSARGSSEAKANPTATVTEIPFEP